MVVTDKITTIFTKELNERFGNSCLNLGENIEGTHKTTEIPEIMIRALTEERWCEAGCSMHTNEVIIASLILYFVSVNRRSNEKNVRTKTNPIVCLTICPVQKTEIGSKHTTIRPRGTILSFNEALEDRTIINEVTEQIYAK